jgi:uncharacterized phage protein (TIGR01671 family)
MNRPIEFRAWDKKESKWASTNILLDYSGLLIWAFGYGYNLVDDQTRYDVQLFTGLKDRSGVKIFEGDIVRTVHSVRCGETETNISEVRYASYHKKEEHDDDTYCNAGFSPFCYHANVEDCWYNNMILEIEVIGNIWENKELLK